MRGASAALAASLVPLPVDSFAGPGEPAGLGAAEAVMAGAAALSVRGVRSTLFADNQTGAGMVGGAVPDLAFDPQTAGGLLAAECDLDHTRGAAPQHPDPLDNLAALGFGLG